MNRSDISNFSHTKGLDTLVVLPAKEIAEKQRSERDAVYEMVFAPDARTGLPNSDISVYLSSKTPPQVREFIQQNIMGEGLPAPSKIDGIDDADLHELTRRSNETADEYARRVTSYMERQRSVVSDAVVSAKRNQVIRDFKK